MEKRFGLALVFAGLILFSAAPANSQTNAPAPSGDSKAEDRLVQVLIKKGVLNADEAKEIQAESDAETNVATPQPHSIWKVSDSIKSIQIFGDVRFRYEYRGVDNLPGATPDTYYRERLRYSLRFGIRGDLTDNFNYGIRLETGSWARSPWVTFGNNTTAGSVSPSDKAGSGIFVGQIYLGWHPEDWMQLIVGRMPQPLYTTPMVWSPNLSPEGFFEKFNKDIGSANVFAGFGQFDYQDPTEATEPFLSDLFVLAWQLGVKGQFTKDLSYEMAPVIYNYTGTGSGANGLGQTFVGQGNALGENVGIPGGTPANITAYNQVGVNNLLVLEVPAELDYQIHHTFLGPLQARLFGDFAYNINGNERAQNAFNQNPGAFPAGEAATGQNFAYQAGIGIGSGGLTYGPSQGLVYGSTSRKNAWEARFYWQQVDQYALDPNLLDPDFFEGAANLKGIYVAFAYSISDAIIGTVRYGYATRVDTSLGTASSDLDIPNINPINNYNLFQFDLAWRF